jgi:septum formation protein
MPPAGSDPPMLILASASPRRQELLRNAGISFAVQPAGVPEAPLENESARNCAERLARAKARAVFRRHQDAVVLGADTVVVVDGQILGKPGSADDATGMLRLLSGRTHEVITGVCLSGPGPRLCAANPPGGASEQKSGFEDVRSECTEVTMAELSDQEIRAYVASGEPMDKAGAYAIQGRASRWIGRIEGDYFNVVGLPVALVFRMLQEHAILEA